MLKRLGKLILCLSIIASFYSQYVLSPEKAEASANNPILNGRTPGILNVYKEVKKSDYHHIIGNVEISDTENLFMTVGDVQVSGPNSGNGQTVIYSIAKQHSNNGYPYIDKLELDEWVTIFGGNRSFMTNANGLYAHDITGQEPGAKPYSGYLLSKIAEMSGGKGLNPEFTTIGDPDTTDPNVAVYKSLLKFETTPRPEGDIGVGGKSTYNVGDTVPINFWAKDYSYYDRGINVLSYYIYNLDTGKVEVEFKDQSKNYSDPRGSGPNYGGTGSPYLLTVGGQSFIPTKAGRYEARVLLTDLHMRNSQNAPAVGGAGIPYSKPFTVGGGVCGPIDSTLKITGQSDQQLSSGGTYKLPKGKNTINNLTFPVAGILKIGNVTVGTGTSFSNLLIDSDKTATFTPTDSAKCEWTFQFFAADPVSTECSDCKGVLNIQTYTASGKGELNAPISSGGTQFVASDADYLRIEAPVSGKWYDASGNVIPMSSSVKSTSYTIDNFSQSSLTLKFVSDDGTYCWCKTIQRNTPTGSISCPRIYRAGKGDLEAGGPPITDIPLGGSLNLSATFIDQNGDKQSANVYWVITKPDGTTVKQVWSNDKSKWTLNPNSILNLPITSGYAPSDQLIEFKQKGTYTIAINYDGLTKDPYDSWRAKNCNWSVSVIIVDMDQAVCSDFTYDVDVDGQKVSMTGSGTQGAPYVMKVPKGEPNAATFRMLYKGNPQTAEGYWKIESTYGMVGNWGNTFTYDFGPNMVTVPEFSLVVYPRNKEDCKTYFKIVWGDPIQFDCSKVYMTATVDGSNQQLAGEGSSTSPYKMELLLNKDYTVDFKALFNGSGVTDRFDSVTWELSNGKGTTFVGTGNTYQRTFKEAAAGTYTLKLRVKGKGQSQPCPDKILVIDFRSQTCKDLTIQFKLSGNDWSRESGDEIIKSPGVDHVLLIDSNTGIQIAVTTDSNQPSDANKLKATWTVTETTSGKTIANDSTTPGTLFEKNKIPAGHYTVKIKVTDTSNPAFTGCEVYISLSLNDKGADCGRFYLHVLAFDKNQTVDQAQTFWDHNGKTVKLEKSTDQIMIWINQSPNSLKDNWGEGVNVDWTVPSPWVDTPLFDDVSKDFTVWQKTPIPNGTYTITGKLNDKQFTAKCNFTVTIVIGEKTDPEPPKPCDTCNPGGGIDGGQLKIKIYDSGNRLLTGPTDGVWEKERARIDVEIDQSKIDAAFAKVDSEIKKAIGDKKAEFEAKYGGDGYRNLKVLATPDSWQSKVNSKTHWQPNSLSLTVNGPGIDAAYQLDPKLAVQSNTYTGTTVPTKKGNTELSSVKYVTKAEGFDIKIDYDVKFAVSFQKCERKSPGTDPDTGDPLPEVETCTDGTDSGNIANNFTISVKDDQTQFEVFDLWIEGVVRHTDIWNKNRQAYNRVKTGNPESPRYYDMYWAGEKFMLHADTPDTGVSPVKASSVKVTMSTTNVSTFLNPSNSYTFDGSMWQQNFQYLKDGVYTFTFVATWNHGHTETDTYTIVISDPYTKFFELHRLH